MKLIKQNTLFALFGSICISTASFAQLNDYNKWSVEPSFGVNKVFTGYSPGYGPKVVDFFSAGVSGRYMLSEVFGVQATFGVNQYLNKRKTQDYKSYQSRVSLQAVLNVGQLTHFDTWTKKLGLLVHGGAGGSSLRKDKMGFLFKSDNMVHVTLGVTPQIKLSEKVALQLDFSMYGNLLQANAFDFKNQIGTSGFDSFEGQATIGVAFYLGKHKQHADWHKPYDPLKSTVDSLKVSVTENTDKIAALESRVEKTETEIEKLKSDLGDDDNDGVANKFDIEPNTPEGVRVDTKGQEIKDLVPNSGQSLDAERGLFFTVQLGVYSKDVPEETFKNLGVIETKTMPDMTVRYFTGIFHSQDEAEVKHKEAVKAGIKDAFMTAYYKGERITLVEARTILAEKGPSILANKR